MTHPYLRKSEVAQMLRVTTRTIENYVKNKRLCAPVKVGGRPLWPLGEVQKALQGVSA